MKKFRQVVLAAAAALVLAGLAPAQAAAQSYCDTLTNGLRLPKPNFNTPSWQFGGCIRNSFDIINSSVPLIGSTATFSQIWTSTISGRNGSGLYLSSYTLVGSSVYIMGHAQFGSSLTLTNGAGIGGAVTFNGSSVTVRGEVLSSTLTAHAGYVLNALTVGSSVTLRDGQAIGGAGAFNSSWTAKGAFGVGGTLALTSGQAITGAATFTSTVTMKGAAGVPSLFIENPADDAQVRMCNRTYSATCANITQFSISNGGDFSLFSNGDQVFVNDFPNVYFAYAGLKFGIGTTAPDTKLDVAGDAQFGSGVAKATFSATGMLSFPAGGGVTTQATFGSSVSVVGAASVGASTWTATMGVTARPADDYAMVVSSQSGRPIIRVMKGGAIIFGDGLPYQSTDIRSGPGTLYMPGVPYSVSGVGGQIIFDDLTAGGSIGMVTGLSGYVLDAYHIGGVGATNPSEAVTVFVDDDENKISLGGAGFKTTGNVEVRATKNGNSPANFILRVSSANGASLLDVTANGSVTVQSTVTVVGRIAVSSGTAQFKFASISLADDGTYAMETNFGSKGIVKIVGMTTNTGYCVFSISGAGNSVGELEDPFTACSDADTDGFIDMIADGDGTYTLKNRQGAAREFAVEYIGQ